MANLQLPLNQDHEVLGSEYCSGYVDALGKWNTGFYCPASDESQDVFCCGTEYHKYCCTKKDQVIQAEVKDLTVLIGIIVGASAAILILTMVSCFCCSCCLLYKKRNPSSNSMYRLHNSSEHSGVTNMYSLSNTGGSSRANTPLPQLQRQQQQHLLQQQQQHYYLDDGMVGGAPAGDIDMADQIRLIQHHHHGHHNGGIAASYTTLPHSLSHNSKLAASSSSGYNHMHHTLQRHSYRNDNPDLIASTQTRHQGIVPREYGTLGRMGGGQLKAMASASSSDNPPPYHDFQAQQRIQRAMAAAAAAGDNTVAYAQFAASSDQLNSASAGVPRDIGIDDTAGLSSISKTLSGSQARMIFPHQQQAQAQQEHQQDQEGQLFHSTKF